MSAFNSGRPLRWAALALLAAWPALGQVQELENPGLTNAVQSRPYRMGHELSLAVGVLPLDSFSKGVYPQVSYTLHFSDTFAWTLGRAAWNFGIDTGLKDRLETVFQVQPTVVETVQFFVGSDLLWKPFYGKLAAFNRAVIHGEMYLLLGVTLFRYTNEFFRPGVNLGGGGRIFVSQNVSFRLEIAHNIVIPTSAGTPINNVLTVSLGFSINFGGN